MRDVSTTGGYVPFSIYKYMKKKHVSSFPVILRKRFMDNIPGFSGYYVSKRGRVYTRRRVGLGRKSKTGVGDLNRVGYWRELTRITNHKGYYRLVIQDDFRKRHYVQVSRLVALAYIPNPLNKPFVCHKENNPKNNFYKNLYWGTQSENIQQCVKDGRHQSCKLNM